MLVEVFGRDHKCLGGEVIYGRRGYTHGINIRGVEVRVREF